MSTFVATHAHGTDPGGERARALDKPMHDKPIALRLLPAERSEHFDLAAEDGRSAASLAVKCYRDGMALYKQRRAALLGASC